MDDFSRAAEKGDMLCAFGRLAFLTLAIACVSCRVGPDHCGPPASPVGASYPTDEHAGQAELTAKEGHRNGNNTLPSEAADGADEAEAIPAFEALPGLVDWWTALNDPILNELIVVTVEQNLDLRVAAERIFESQARRGTVASSLFPQIDTDGAYTHELRPSGGLFGGRSRDWFGWGTNLSWEIDVFGRLHRLLEAADADVGERQELYRDTLILLIAETAIAYVEARSHQEQIAIVEANINIQEETVRLVRSRFDNDKADMLDVRQSEGSLKGVAAGDPTYRILYRQAVNRLSVLTGRPPGAVDALMSEPRPIPHVPDQVAVGIPADLLRRRPDVRSVERKVAGQSARIGAAIGELYPQFSINGTFGLGANEFGQLWSRNAIEAGITPAMRWQILNFGRYRCNVYVQESLHRQYVWEYQDTVLRAAEEVDNALVRYVEGKKRRELLQASVNDYAEAVRLSQIKYRAGAVDLQRVLDSQRSLLASEQLLVVNRSAVVQSFITLYRALGGGWQLPVQQVTPMPVPLANPDTELLPTPAGIAP